MSWSFSAVGKPAAVLAKAQKELEAIKCSEPEETIKTKVRDILVASLSSMPASAAVQVVAAGSQSVDYSDKTRATNSLTFEIKPLYGFVE